MEINNNDQLLWRYLDNRAGSTFNDTFVVRQDVVVGPNPVIAMGSDFFTSTPFNYVDAGITLNDVGRGMMGADLKSGGTVLASRDDGTSTHNTSSSVGGFPIYFPKIANNNKTIVRYGDTTADPLYLFDDETFSSATIIAQQPAFNAIAGMPGISDDGSAITFLGVHSIAGTGIFEDNGIVLFKIAGISGDGQLDPGETYTDNNGNGIFDTGDTDIGFFSGFGSVTRVGVNRSSVGSSNFYTVVYIALSTSVGTPAGLYTSQVDVTDPSNPVVQAPRLVAEVGGTITGLTGTITAIDIYDVINNNGVLTFWVSTATDQAIIKADPNINKIDKWWATTGDVNPLDVTWTVGLGNANNIEEYTLYLTFDTAHQWWIRTLPIAKIFINGGNLTTELPVDLTPDPAIPNNRARAVIGQLDPGIYTIRVSGFTVPTKAVVDGVQFRLEKFDTSSGQLQPAHRKLEALFVADHPEPSLTSPLTIRLDNSAALYNTQQIIEKFAPFLKFDDGTGAGAIGGAEKFTQAYDASVVYSNNTLFKEDLTGEESQTMDLSVFNANPLFTGASAVYGSILKKSDLIARGMLPVGGPDEIAINYWFHYPRNDWKDHGGFNNHEGDWEGVTIFLKDNGTFFEANRASFSQHEKTLWGVDTWDLRTDGGTNVKWSDIESPDGFRFNVYVGLGGHASYYKPGKTNYVTPELLKKEFHNGQFGTIYDALSGSQMFLLARVGEIATSDWFHFPGHWGILNLPGNFGNFGNEAPKGPVFLESGFSYGTRWLNPWAWSKGFDFFQSLTDAVIQGTTSIVNNVADLLADGIDAVMTWNNVELSSLAAGVQFNYFFTQPGDGDVLDVLVNGTSVGTLLGTANVNTDFALSPMFDISAYAGQTVSLELRLRSVNPIDAQVLLEDISIVNPDFADLVMDSNTYTSKTYVRGESLPINTTVRNQGTFEIISSQDYDVGVYLSTDNIWDVSDRLIHTQTVDSVLPSGATELLNLPVIIPADMTVGNYYVIVRVDEGSQVLELDETNNVFVSTLADITIAQDTTQPAPIVTLSATPPAIVRGETLALGWTVTDAVSCTASGDWSGSKNASGGSEVLAPQINSNYALDCSGLGGDSSGAAMVTVTNNPPLLSAINAQVIGEGSLLSLPLAATDTTGETLILTAQLSDGSSLSTIGASLIDNGDGTGTFSWTPGYTQAGNYSIIFDVSDGLLNDSQTVGITVNNVIVPPPTVSLSTNVSSIEAGQPFQVTIGGSSSVGLASVWWFIEDVNNRVFHTIPGSVDGVAVNLAAAQNFGAGNGLTTYSRTYTVIVDEVGSYEVKANARDLLYPNEGEPHQASEGLGIPVVPVNVAPVMAAINSQVVVAAQSLTFSVSAQDVEGDTLTLSIDQTTVPDASFSSSPTTVLADGSSTIEGEFSWVPTNNQIGTYMVTFKATDDRGAQLISDPVEIKVIAKNHRPRIRFFRNIGNRWLVWLGYDKEDKRNLWYSYRIDKGAWSNISRQRWISVRSLNLTKGQHSFEIYAVDQQGLKSKIRRKRLRIR